MLEYLLLLPSELLGQHMLGYLELIDIIQFENAALSHEFQQLLRSILPYCPPIKFDEILNNIIFDLESINWFNNRQCHAHFISVSLQLLNAIDCNFFVLEKIELYLSSRTSLYAIKPLFDYRINKSISTLSLCINQDPVVMEVLFSLLNNVNSLNLLELDSSTLFQWMQHIKLLGPSLRELLILKGSAQLQLYVSLTAYCPYLQKLRFWKISGVSDSNSIILETIASNCPHLRSLDIFKCYLTNADLTAIAEKCPHLEELSLDCEYLIDKSVIALAQHWSRLKKLYLRECTLTIASLIALSERGLPLEELDIPWIPPIPSVEIAAQCAHALSRIRKLRTSYNLYRLGLFFVIQYMTGLRHIYFDCSYDYLLLPFLSQYENCTDLVSVNILPDTKISLIQLINLISLYPELHALSIYNDIDISDEILVELGLRCPQLKEITLNCSEVTKEGVLALAAHCRQLRVLVLPCNTVTEEMVRQLAQHCRHLVCVQERKRKGEVMVERSKDYSSKDIRALRENKRESSRANQSYSSCLIL